MSSNKSFRKDDIPIYDVLIPYQFTIEKTTLFDCYECALHIEPGGRKASWLFLKLPFSSYLLCFNMHLYLCRFYTFFLSFILASNILSSRRSIKYSNVK